MFGQKHIMIGLSVVATKWWFDFYLIPIDGDLKLPNKLNCVIAFTVQLLAIELVMGFDPKSFAFWLLYASLFSIGSTESLAIWLCKTPPIRPCERNRQQLSLTCLTDLKSNDNRIKIWGLRQYFSVCNNELGTVRH